MSSGVRRLAVVPVVGLLALVLPWIALPTSAYADAPPLPISIPASVAGAAESTGGLSLGGPEVAGLALAGLGAFQGTCYVLGVVYHDPGGCASGLHNILHLDFGAMGDDRTSSGTVAAGAVTSGNLAFTVTGSAGAWYAAHYGTVPVSPSNTGTECEVQFSLPSKGTFSGSAVLTTTTTIPISGFSAFSGVTRDSCNSISASHPYSLTALYLQSGTRFTPSGAVTYVDPPQSWTVTYTLTCENGTTTASETSTVHFTPTASGSSPDPTFDHTCAELLSGSHVKSLGVSGGRDTVSNPEVNVVYPTFNNGAVASYPDCTTNAPTGGCWLDLQKDGKSCFSAGTSCVGWTTHTGDWNLTCKWGSYNMPMSDCEDAYGSTDFSTVPTSDPSPTSGPAPSSGPSTDPSSDPSASPSSDASGEVFPRTGVNPDGDTGTDPATSADAKTSNCWGTGWSWNPVSWVFIPVKCALVWAFVPPGPPSAWDDLVTTLKTRPPISVIWGVGDMFAGVVSGYESAGDCGVLADFGTIGGHSAKITCAAVTSIPGFGALYLLVKAGLAAFTILGCFKLVQRAAGGGGSA